MAQSLLQSALKQKMLVTTLKENGVTVCKKFTEERTKMQKCDKGKGMEI